MDVELVSGDCDFFLLGEVVVGRDAVESTDSCVCLKDYGVPILKVIVEVSLLDKGK